MIVVLNIIFRIAYCLGFLKFGYNLLKKKDKIRYILKAYLVKRIDTVLFPTTMGFTICVYINYMNILVLVSTERK